MFETLEEAITLVPGENQSCFTFDPFSLDVSTILDGLCTRVGSGSSIKLTPTASSPILPYLTGTFPFSKNVNLSGLSKSANVQEYIDNGTQCDQCVNIAAEWYLPDPVTCGCADFDLEFILYPCIGSSPNCPPLVLNKTIQICCSCDIRSTPPGF